MKEARKEGKELRVMLVKACQDMTAPRGPEVHKVTQGNPKMAWMAPAGLVGSKALWVHLVWLALQEYLGFVRHETAASMHR